MDKENLDLQLLIKNFHQKSSQPQLQEQDTQQNLLMALIFITLGLVFTLGGFICLLLRLSGLVPLSINRLKNHFHSNRALRAEVGRRSTHP